MKIRAIKLGIEFKSSVETIEFQDITFFYGSMGAGKSTILRLVDFCLGADLDLNPAMQSEFVAATLRLKLSLAIVTLTRLRNSAQIRAVWQEGDTWMRVVLPAKKADGLVLPNTEVEVVSDLIFYLSGMSPPRVRKSKKNEDSDLQRLSMRNLMWYCYLDQDFIDSDFFHLDDAFTKQLPSRDVLRVVLGFHQEKVASLESELEQIRGERRAVRAAADMLDVMLKDLKVVSTADLDTSIGLRNLELKQVDERIANYRIENQSTQSHLVDQLRQELRVLASEAESLENTSDQLKSRLRADTRYLNELKSLSARVYGSAVAVNILEGFDFLNCPRCEQLLPMRTHHECAVCGQNDNEESQDRLQYLDADLSTRISGVESQVHASEEQLAALKTRLDEIMVRKSRRDGELSRSMNQYDSAFLAATLDDYRRRSEVMANLQELNRQMQLRSRLEVMRKNQAKLEARESMLRIALREARVGAESDLGNLRLLERLFLDCLTRSGIPGISPSSSVSISGPHYLPEVVAPESEGTLVTSFTNISSGGKKTLFKSCFAVAFHRLARLTGAILPSVLMIDTPMKNISERENKEQFAGFYSMLYELVETDLKGTQIIIVDKEMYPPPSDLNASFSARHMAPADSQNPPLIRFYRGP